MRICQIAPIFPYYEHLTGAVSGGRYRWGGIGQYVYSLSKELSKLGHQVTIIAPKAPQHNTLSEIEMEGVGIHRISPIFHIYSCSLPLGIFKDLKPAQYDVIHAHTPVPAIAELVALRVMKSSTPLILTYHNDVVKAGAIGRILSAIYGPTLAPFLLGRAKLIVTLTRSLAENSARLASHTHRVRVVPGAVNEKQFHTGLDRNKIRNKYGLGPEAKVILFVGILDAYKGCAYLVRAVAKVINKIPEARLILVGKGPMADELKTLAGKLGIGQSVIFAGFVPDEDLAYYYAACDVFVLPSVSSEEGFGLVQLEAMACGKPVVTTTLPGVSEVDAEEVATIHVPPKNTELLASAIIRILRDSDLAASLGNGGRKLVESKYTVAKIARDMQGVYSEAINGKRQTGAIAKS